MSVPYCLDWIRLSCHLQSCQLCLVYVQYYSSVVVETTFVWVYSVTCTKYQCGYNKMVIIMYGI